MKTKRTQKFLKNLKRKSAFDTPGVNVSAKEAITDLVRSVMDFGKSAHRTQDTGDASVPTHHLGALVSIGNNFWRARKRMSDSGDGEVREDMKRVHDRVEAIRRSLVEVGIVIRYYPEVRDECQPATGIVIRDHTGDAYDEGQPMKVVANKPTPGLDKKRVSETLLPSIFWNNRLVQNGEIEIATPASPNISDESLPHQP